MAERRAAGSHARPRLTPERIAAAALDVVDAEGLDALTMRRLGTVLGVEAMAIYHHFRSKEAVFDAIVAALVAELSPPGLGPDLPWEERLCRIWTHFRAIHRRHPNALPLLFTRPVVSRGNLGQTEQLLAALFDAGLSAREVVDAWRALGSYAIGYLTVERYFETAQRDAAWTPPEQAVDAARYPSWHAVLPHLDRDWDEQFRAALRVIIAGVRARARDRGPR